MVRKLLSASKHKHTQAICAVLIYNIITKPQPLHCSCTCMGNTSCWELSEPQPKIFCVKVESRKCT